jgi:lipopolysaccharide/colanic/teichoic acid biosynthesis glycosyltransferase
MLLVTALAILILSRGSPLVAHLRLGRYGTPFRTLKFRTMWPAERCGRLTLLECIGDVAGPNLKSADDPRVTSAFARFCRRFSIDELPQLANVVRGDMSLVGPRPLTAAELREHYSSAIDEVLSVKPGITGLWQVMGRSRLTYERRRRLDLFLVRRWSARLYVAILLRTIPEVLRGRDAW